MDSDRLKALTDGVVAVIITVMVLEMKPPEAMTFAASTKVAPVFLIFTLIPEVTGGIPWANLHLLFWLSVIPFNTAWVGEHELQTLPTAVYGCALLACALAWYLMQRIIVCSQEASSALKRAIGTDRKVKISPLIYVIGIGFSFLYPIIAVILYAGAAALWLVPDRRVDGVVRENS